MRKLTKRELKIVKSADPLNERDETKRKMTMTKTIRRWQRKPELCRTNFELGFAELIS